MKTQVLIVDDDDLLRRSLAFKLEQDDFKVKTVGDAETAFAVIAQNIPDIILLDIMLPGIDGLEALRHFREKAGIPVILLTARRRELDEVVGLEIGADDYITKPFNSEVVAARIRTVLRRVNKQEKTPRKTDVIAIGKLVIDAAARTVKKDGRLIELGSTEFDLLHTLALELNRVMTIEDLLVRVWGAEFTGETQSVYVYIRWLREKIEDDPHRPSYIITVRGVGYKMVMPGSNL
jgi:DNA-binding response OmpR family regulator